MRYKWFILSLIVVFTSCINDSGRTLGVGERLPHFSVTMHDGTQVSDVSLHGTPAVIVFFHTGCPDCQKELPVIEQFYRQQSAPARIVASDVKPAVNTEEAEPVAVVCISRAEAKESVQAYWSGHGFTMPYSAQPDRKVYELFASTGIPRIYKINKEGIIVAAWDDILMPSLSDLSAIE